MGSKAIPGVFIGYHINPGGVLGGDYIVADLAHFRQDHDVARSKVKIHRIREVVTNHTGKFIYPVALWRQKRLLRADDFSAPDDPDMHALVNTSDDEDAPPRPPGSSGDGIGVLSESSDPLPPPPRSFRGLSTPAPIRAPRAGPAPRGPAGPRRPHAPPGAAQPWGPRATRGPGGT